MMGLFVVGVAVATSLSTTTTGQQPAVRTGQENASISWATMMSMLAMVVMLLMTSDHDHE